MKIRIQYSALPALEIEGQPQDVAQMVWHLNNLLVTGGGEEMPELQNLANNVDDVPQPPAATPTAATKPDEKRPSHAGRQKQGSVARARTQADTETPAEAILEERARKYAGEPNRREKVLYCLEQLWLEGEREPNLDRIRRTYNHYFPDDNVTHLDQVIRDLANKTDHVYSPQRGRYALHASYIKQL